MARSATEWERQFREWAEGPGDTELGRCDNAERMIRKAISASTDLKAMRIDVFSQGSFKNVTNIPQDSDVDVSVCVTDLFYYRVPDGADKAALGLGGQSNFKYPPYKAAVAKALQDHFGKQNVTVGNKAIRIHSNSYRVDADVVPNCEYHYYYDTRDRSKHDVGVWFQADDGKQCINYPKQHIERDLKKNAATKKRFKRIVRVLKSLQVEMHDKGIVTDTLPSFFIESLVYNVPDDRFNYASYKDNVQAVLAYLFNNTRPSDDASKWLEANNIKYLFHSTQPWTKAQAHAFVSAAWNYVGFG